MRRSAHILTELEAARSVAAEDLSRTLGVSRRTLASELIALQAALSPAATVTLVDGRYRLLVADPAGYREARRQLMVSDASFNDPGARASFIVGRLFTSLVPVRIDELATAMSVGRTTVVADLARLRGLLEESDLEIEGRTNVGLVLEGPELLQRLHVLRYHFAATFPDEEQLRAVRALAADVASQAGLNPSKAFELARWGVVAVNRARLGCRLESLPDTYRSVEGTPAHDFAQRFAAAIDARFDANLGRGDVGFLALPVIGMRAPDDVTVAERYAHSDVAGLVEEILAAVDAEMAINLEGSAFLGEFARHVSFMVNRMRYRIWVDGSAMGDISQEYPVAYRMATVASRVIGERMGLPVESAEVGYLATYFQVFLSSRDAAEAQPLMVTVVAGAGRIAAELVRLQIAKILPDSARIQVLTPAESSAAALSDADLVVVTDGSAVDCAAPVIHVTHVLDRLALETQIRKVRLRLPITPGDSKGSVLAGALDSRHFFALPPGTSFAEGIEYMSRQLEARHLAEPGFSDRIVARGAERRMQLDEWVGFPHITLESTADVLLAVGVVPSELDEPGIRIIVMLGVPAVVGRSDDILVAVYDEVLRLGGRHDLIDQLCRVTTYEEFFYVMETNPLEH